MPEPLLSVTGRAVPVPGDDLDTDQIIPARFMKCVTFDGLGEYLFHDVRKTADGSLRKHPLNDERFAQATILISGRNFGCGSSREHAPQAIDKAGFKAVIADNFAEIFFGNSSQLGIPCVSLARAAREALAAAVEADPSLEVTIDVENLQVRAGEATYACTLREGARQGFLNGAWDPLDELVAADAQITEVASTLPYLQQ